MTYGFVWIVLEAQRIYKAPKEKSWNFIVELVTGYSLKRVHR